MGNGDCLFSPIQVEIGKYFLHEFCGSFGLLEYNTDKILKYCEKAGYLPIKRVFQEKVWKFSGGNFPATFISYSVAVCIFLWMSKKAIRGPLILSNAQIWIFDTESEGGIVRRGSDSLVLLQISRLPSTSPKIYNSPEIPLFSPRSTGRSPTSPSGYPGPLIYTPYTFLPVLF